VEWAGSTHPVGSGPEEGSVSGRMKFAIAGIVVGLILWFVSPWLALIVIAAAIAIPVGAYLMLDPSQRRRLREIRRRKQIGG
jgi:ABC-type bacteriocin/lantibiotic exporter with double-glycine peptidase domain